MAQTRGRGFEPVQMRYILAVVSFTKYVMCSVHHGEGCFLALLPQTPGQPVGEWQLSVG